MFGKANRPLRTVARFEDLLFGHAGATDGPEGSARVEVKVKGAKEPCELFVRCAEVPGLGPVAHVSAPVTAKATPDAAAKLLEKASSLSVGDVVATNGGLELRATIAFAEATYGDVVALFEPLAAAACELGSMLEQ